MVNHHQLVLKNKYISLMSQYGVEVETQQVEGGPLLCLTGSIAICCSKETFGVTKLSCSPCPACGQLRSLC